MDKDGSFLVFINRMKVNNYMNQIMYVFLLERGHLKINLLALQMKNTRIQLGIECNWPTNLFCMYTFFHCF